MMTIKFGPDKSGLTSNAAWWVGSASPLNNEQVSMVIEVQADGDELMWVLRYIDGIPKHETRMVQKWFGDDAKFIVGTLR